MKPEMGCIIYLIANVPDKASNPVEGFQHTEPQARPAVFFVSSLQWFEVTKM
ncbi:hypothetical protein [Paenibacillus sp. A3]|uniref:hypothetical protein n=1 Tax=Paenibacillus sp. A3 TaxID=1337054 RepID=UPI000B2B5D3E|nr:hypothetical protein [Paenibacillus sp. A3]